MERTRYRPVSYLWLVALMNLPTVQAANTACDPLTHTTSRCTAWLEPPPEGTIYRLAQGTTGGSHSTYIVLRTVNVRSRPSTDSAVLGILETGKIVTIVGTSSGWYKVPLETGVEGYVYKDFLRNAATDPSPTSAPAEPDNRQQSHQTHTEESPDDQAAPPATATDLAPQGIAQPATAPPVDETSQPLRILTATLSPISPPPNTTAATSVMAPETNRRYHIRNYWRGQTQRLRVDNAGIPYLAQAEPQQEPLWQLQALEENRYKLLVGHTDPLSPLDLEFDEHRIARPRMADTATDGWQFHPVGDGYYRITHASLGKAYALDVINDGVNNNQLVMAPSGSYAGQYWFLEPSHHHPSLDNASQKPWSGPLLSLGTLEAAAQREHYPILAALSLADYFETELEPWFQQHPEILDVFIETLQAALALPEENCHFTSDKTLVCRVWSKTDEQPYSLSLVNTDAYGWMLNAFWTDVERQSLAQ